MFWGRSTPVDYHTNNRLPTAEHLYYTKSEKDMLAARIDGVGLGLLVRQGTPMTGFAYKSSAENN